MHWRTYNRLTHEHLKAMQGWMGATTALLDKIGVAPVEPFARAR